MKKNDSALADGFPVQEYKSILIWIMKRTLFVFFVFFLSTASFAFSQRVSLRVDEVTLGEAFKQISKETNVDFFYSDNELNVDKIVSGSFEDVELTTIVKTLVGRDFEVQKETENIILIVPAEKKNQQQTIVTGKIIDDQGVPLFGVTVVVKGTRQGGVSDDEGNYRILANQGDTLVFTYIGFNTKEVEIIDETTINVILSPDVSELDEVVVTGIVERKKESYTGAVNTISGEELKDIGNQNVIQSIKTLDPSFIVLDNNELGSNPNVLPNIEIRGKTSVSTTGVRDEFDGDPNQPLFILDGFETDLRTIVDLDMNRVKSITILKDATSTALYGAKAANGVVVVETVRPKVGELRVSYTGDFRVEIPDLTDYNLMNAEEKLIFEKLSGRWDISGNNPSGQVQLDSVYNAKLADVRRGVDTYWLEKPLQTGFSQKHAVYLSGGSENLYFGAGVNYNNIKGVMIGSGRQTWGGNLDVTYRKGKLNITNRLYVNGYDADESNYGDFSEYARANPYYRPYDEDGRITKYLDEVNISGVTSYNIANPLYNSTLNSSDNTVGFDIRNSLQAIYRFDNSFRITAGLQLKKGSVNNEIFESPQETQFDDVDIFERGRYTNSQSETFSYFGNIMLVYSKLLNEKHSINANVRADIEESRRDRYNTVAVGFPAGTNGNPSFAFGYEPNAKPGYRTNIYRRNNILGSVNYTYDKKYLVDATYRMDGSTAFGSNKKYSPFWSFGLGWNLHEEFNFDPKIISLLKIRGNIGLTGNQNFGSVATTSIYQYNNAVNVFGPGVDLIQLANEDLEWQNTLQSNLGVDFKIFDRFSGSLEFYKKTTDPLVVSIDLPSSTGVASYPLNAGQLDVKGFETILKYAPIYKVKEQIVWTIGATATSYTSEYSGFNNKLESLNDGAQESNSLIRYKDGYSPDDIWAVPSLGIDPATGKEVFLKKNGQTSFEYDADDVVAVGNLRPKLQGVLSSNLNYKGFLVGVNIRYRLGGDTFNRALYEKVENISRTEVAYNQDARALYDRWQEPGDIAKYKGISLTEYTPISSRFVQEVNELIGESINLGYRASDKQWVKKLGLQSVRFNLYMNDIFRWSSIEVERGITYPFARSVSFSINASF
ncbi:SusC/RagA family TonB-linked outer membrane protein [Joostella sp. CR20]|uniref:SusC/RagA family TonB-linked outer membrane protein n=1 Tax=Joostella sp. CR20 TaxID=2804312 RepID=UPI00313EA340